jgi:adenylate cyclase class 2
LEIEVKVAVPDVRAVAEKARGLGWELVRRRHFEANVLFDYPERSLSLSGCLLRVRETESGALLTFKGRVEEHERYKVRPETETTCESGPAVRAILESLGLRPFFRYEKFREEYGGPGALLCLDELPFGHFLELEGEAGAIEAMASALGIDPDRFLKRSYADLYGERCRELGVPFGDIVFPAADAHP